VNWEDPKVKSDIFSLKMYENTLLKALDYKYRFIQVRDVDQGITDNTIILRHDIEYGVERAYQMAKLEKKIGVRSSYFVLVHSIFYNPFTPENTRMLVEMHEMGHEIGLHYETYYFEDRGLDPADGILHDATYLEKMLGIKIKSISQHRPARSTVVEKLGEHYIDAYRKDLIYDLFYISDSGCKWRNDNLYNSLGENKKIHALLHPDYWGGEETDDLPFTYRAITEDNCKIIRDECELLIKQNFEYLTKRDQLDKERRKKYLDNNV
jgi:hypothetical protein